MLVASANQSAALDERVGAPIALERPVETPAARALIGSCLGGRGRGSKGLGAFNGFGREAAHTRRAPEFKSQSKWSARPNDDSPFSLARALSCHLYRGSLLPGQSGSSHFSNGAISKWAPSRHCLLAPPLAPVFPRGFSMSGARVLERALLGRRTHFLRPTSGAR